MAAAPVRRVLVVDDDDDIRLLLHELLTGAGYRVETAPDGRAALRTFHEDFAGAVTRRTTLIVIGDGRNNYNAPEAWVLDELRRRARRLLWMCPEPRAAWGTGDSEMSLYAARCDRVATVATLEELEGVADELVPRGTA